MTKLAVVGAAVIRDGRCLVAKRSDTMSFPGCWEFPGGKVEPGETPQQALERELEEELAVQVEVHEWLGRGESAAGPKTIVLDVYRAVLLAGEPMAQEHAALRWCDAEALRDLHWAAADVPILGAVVAALS